jgi:hypothetical protein
MRDNAAKSGFDLAGIEARRYARAQRWGAKQTLRG